MESQRVWVYKLFRGGKAMSVWPHVTFRCEAGGIVEADKKFEIAFGYPPDTTKIHTVLRHNSDWCWDKQCTCKLPVEYPVSH